MGLFFLAVSSHFQLPLFTLRKFQEAEQSLCGAGGLLPSLGEHVEGDFLLWMAVAIPSVSSLISPGPVRISQMWLCFVIFTQASPLPGVLHPTNIS